MPNDRLGSGDFPEDRRMTRDAEPILTLFEALMRAETLESAVQGACRHIAQATESVTTGVVPQAKLSMREYPLPS